MGFAVAAAGSATETREARWTTGCASAERFCLQAASAQSAEAAMKSGVERRRDSFIPVDQHTIQAPGFPPGGRGRKSYTVAWACPPDEGPVALVPAFQARRQFCGGGVQTEDAPPCIPWAPACSLSDEPDEREQRADGQAGAAPGGPQASELPHCQPWNKRQGLRGGGCQPEWRGRVAYVRSGPTPRNWSGPS